MAYFVPARHSGSRAKIFVVAANWRRSFLRRFSRWVEMPKKPTLNRCANFCSEQIPGWNGYLSSSISSHHFSSNSVVILIYFKSVFPVLIPLLMTEIARGNPVVFLWAVFSVQEFRDWPRLQRPQRVHNWFVGIWRHKDGTMKIGIFLWYFYDIFDPINR